MLVARTFVPPEAHEIAQEFRRAAAQLRTSSSNLNSIRDTLDTNWLGHSKDLFFDEFANQPSRVNSLAESLMSDAQTIENIHVTIYVEVPDVVG